MKKIFSICMTLAVLGCAARSDSGSQDEMSVLAEQERIAAETLVHRLNTALESLPAELGSRIRTDYGRFLIELEQVLAEDPDVLLILVDKQHELGRDFVPQDLVPVTTGRSYIPNRADLSLRRIAEESLEAMAASARAAGITLVVSSTYRSWDYQKTVYERNVRQLGQAEADRESARPGTSQHQLGTAVDFGSITDAFAATAAGRWLSDNAWQWGWSLSYPDGYEPFTGYRWESWHYRYIGIKAARLERDWFNGIQQFMLEFIHAWRVAGQ